MTNRLKIGFAGIRPTNWGMRGFAKITDGELGVLDGIELAAAADTDTKSLKEANELFGIEHTFTDYREMLERVELDAVVILLPTFLHKQATIDCLEKGVSVLCEKPPASNYAEMLEIADVARKSPGQYMFIRQSRFSPSAQAARKMVLDGKLGEVYGGEAKWIRSRGGQILGDAWRSEKDKGGGVMLDLGIHGIDLAWFVMGCPKPMEVMASTHTAFKHFARDPDTYTADDTFSGMIRFENGATLQCLFAFGMNTVGVHQPDNPDNPYKTEWQTSQIYGTQAGIDISRQLVIDGPVDKVSVTPLVMKDTDKTDMQLQAEEFISAVRDNRTPLNSLDHALMLMSMLSGLKASAETGRSVTLK